MEEEPDLRFDIDALFEHMTANLDHDPAQEMDWTFSLRSPNMERLETIADGLGDEFAMRLQDSVEVIDVDGETSLGEPLLSIVCRGAMDADEVKALANRMGAIAEQAGVVYEGVHCYDPIDEEELFGWLEPADAGWRLRHFTDCGLEEDAELPWTFLVLANDVDLIQKIVDQLIQEGYDDLEVYDEPDEDGRFGLSIFVMGRNNEVDLGIACENVAGIAGQFDGELKGVQFFTREDMNDLYGEDEADANL